MLELTKAFNLMKYFSISFLIIVVINILVAIFIYLLGHSSFISENSSIWFAADIVELLTAVVTIIFAIQLLRINPTWSE